MCQVVDILDGELVVKGMVLWLGRQLHIGANVDTWQMPAASPKAPRAPRAKNGTSEANPAAHREDDPEAENALDEPAPDMDQVSEDDA